LRLYRRAYPDGNPRQLTSEAPATPYGLAPPDPLHDHGAQRDEDEKREDLEEEERERAHHSIQCAPELLMSTVIECDSLKPVQLQ
jgi:hypothetical protein